MNRPRGRARRPLAARVAFALALTLAALLVPALADSWTYHHLYQRNLYDLDWARMLRVVGSWPSWLIAALALWLHQRGADGAGRRAMLLALSPAAGGILCEIVKLLIRRERPETGDGAWIFREWSDQPLSTAGLATPSSHTMVAFAGATMAARLFPRARWLFYTLAAGCGVTRVLAHAHFVSDVTFGALLGWAVAWGLWLRFGPPGGRPRPA